MKSKKQPTKPAKETERGRAIAVYNPLPIFDEVRLEAKSRVERQRGFSRHLQLVYEAPDWSLATLLSWVIWRDQNRICDISRYSDWRDQWSAQVRYGTDGMNAIAAWRLALNALKNGELVAIEQGVSRTAEHWFGIKADRRSARTIFNRDPRFRREKVLQQWPAEANQVLRKHRKYSSRPAAAKIYNEYIRYASRENKRPSAQGFTTYARDQGLQGDRELLRAEFRERNPDRQLGRPPNGKGNSPK
jgi:hypothetical protein